MYFEVFNAFWENYMVYFCSSFSQGGSIFIISSPDYYILVAFSLSTFLYYFLSHILGTLIWPYTQNVAICGQMVIMHREYKLYYRKSNKIVAIWRRNHKG